MIAFPARHVVIQIVAACLALSAAPVNAAITFGDQPPPVEAPPPKPGQKVTPVAMPQSIAADAANKESLSAAASVPAGSGLAGAVTFGLPAFMLIFAAMALFGAAKMEKRKRHRIVRQTASRRLG